MDEGKAGGRLRTVMRTEDGKLFREIPAPWWAEVTSRSEEQRGFVALPMNHRMLRFPEEYGCIRMPLVSIQRGLGL